MKKYFLIKLLLVILNLNFLTSASNIKHSYDVLNYKLFLNIYDCFKPPYQKSFIAIDQITFKADSTINYINLDAANRSLVIDSVKLLNAVRLNFSHTQNILAISLDRIYNPGEVVNINIYYRHNDVIDTSWGYLALTNGFRSNNGLVYTDCEPEGARKWFPCWDKPSDKATTDITAKVPSNVRLGSNGSLLDSTMIADTIYYHWVNRDPMSTYLIVIAGRNNYNIDIKYWHKLSNPFDSIPIRFYYSNWSNPSKVKDSINLLTNFYSQKFGEYPFEKIGFAECDSVKCGNMEDQSLITVYAGSWDLVGMADHEFAHHWFGDLITCGTWADLWLNESFATYCEALFAEYTHGVNGYINDIRYDSLIYFTYGNYNEPIYNPIFVNGAGGDLFHLFSVERYQKGACVLHMLRTVLGDSVFFNVLHSYATDTNFTFKNAITDDFTAKLNQVSGQDYSWFINEWVKQPGHPVYQNTFNFEDRGNNIWRVNFLAKQTLQYTPFHTMPLEIKVHFTNSSDTLLKVFNNSNNQLFTFDFNKQPDSLSFDPYNKIILKRGTTLIGITNISKEVPYKFSLYQNYPNPFNPSTVIKFDIAKQSFTKLIIYDILGCEVATLINEKLLPGTYEVEWDGTNYSSGVYFYKLTSENFIMTKRLVLLK